MGSGTEKEGYNFKKILGKGNRKLEEQLDLRPKERNGREE